MLTPHLSKAEIGLLFGLLIVMLVGLFFLPPKDFPTDIVIPVKRGQSLEETAQALYAERVIQSPWLFSQIVTRTGGEKSIVAGYYQFESRLPLLAVINRLRQGVSTLRPVKVTIIEGYNNNQIAEVLAQRSLPLVTRADFLKTASSSQGYLFPDTYFFPSEINTDQVIDILQSNFDRQIKPVQVDLKRSGRSLSEVITMASIIEREAADPTDRRTIAGILWKRYDAGQKLQVDVAKVTYQKAGLPEQPIANPGLDAIEATLDPTPSPYWFYLSDSRGEMRYAETYAGHKQNIKKYLQ